MPGAELLFKFCDISATDWPMVSWVGIAAAATAVPPLLKLFVSEVEEAIDVLLLLLFRLAPVAVLAEMTGMVLVEARLVLLWLLFM